MHLTPPKKWPLNIFISSFLLSIIFKHNKYSLQTYKSLTYGIYAFTVFKMWDPTSFFSILIEEKDSQKSAVNANHCVLTWGGTSMPLQTRFLVSQVVWNQVVQFHSTLVEFRESKPIMLFMHFQNLVSHFNRKLVISLPWWQTQCLSFAWCSHAMWNSCVLSFLKSSKIGSFCPWHIANTFANAEIKKANAEPKELE